MYLIRFKPMLLLSCFCVFHFLTPYVEISHLSVFQVLGVYRSIGVKYIKSKLELHFLFTALCLYSMYIYLI